MIVLWFDDQGEAYFSDTVRALIRRSFDVKVETSKDAFLDYLNIYRNTTEVVMILLDWRIEDPMHSEGFCTTIDIFKAIKITGVFGERFKKDIPVRFVTHYGNRIPAVAAANNVDFDGDYIIEKGNPELSKILLQLLQAWI